MTVCAETSAVLRWLFAEEGGEALSFPDLALVSVDERLRVNAALLGFQVDLHQP